MICIFAKVIYVAYICDTHFFVAFDKLNNFIVYFSPEQFLSFTAVFQRM